MKIENFKLGQCGDTGSNQHPIGTSELDRMERGVWHGFSKTIQCRFESTRHLSRSGYFVVAHCFNLHMG